MKRRLRDPRAGHVDHSIVYWIVLILAAIALPRFVEQATGRSLAEHWRDLPPDLTSFVGRTVLLLAGMVVVAFLAEVAAGGRWRTHPGEGRVVIAAPRPGARAAGVGLALIAVHAVWAGLAGQGPFWWVVTGVGALVAPFAVVAIGANERVVVEPDEVRWQSRLFRFETGCRTIAVPNGGGAVTLDQRSTGGAFGQPLVISYTVRIGAEELHALGRADRAEALRDTVAGTLAELRGETAPVEE